MNLTYFSCIGSDFVGQVVSQCRTPSTERAERRGPHGTWASLTLAETAKRCCEETVWCPTSKTDCGKGPTSHCFANKQQDARCETCGHHVLQGGWLFSCLGVGIGSFQSLLFHLNCHACICSVSRHVCIWLESNVSEQGTPENLKCRTFLLISYVSMNSPDTTNNFFPMCRCEKWWRQRTNSYFGSSASICPFLPDMPAPVNEASAWFVVNSEFAQQKCASTPSVPGLYVWNLGGDAMIWTILAFAFLVPISGPNCVKIMTLGGAVVLRWLWF